MAAMVDLTIAGRTYQVACREGEEENLAPPRAWSTARAARRSPGLARCREARQFLFASLLLADQLIDKQPGAAAAPSPRRTRPRACPPRRIARRAARIACGRRLRMRPRIAYIGRDGHCPVRAFGKSLRRYDPNGSCPCPDPGPDHTAPT